MPRDCCVALPPSAMGLSAVCDYSVRDNTRELNKICSGNLYPFSRGSIMEHILAPTNESRLGDKVSTFSQHFQDCIY